MEYIKARLIVSGKVTKRGYRVIVKEIADKLGIKGNVKNTPDEKVEIVCEGQKEHVEKFIAAIGIKERFINVENIDKKFDEPTGKFEDFKIIREESLKEIEESTEAGATYLRAFLEDTNRNFDNLNVKYGTISEKLGKFEEVMVEMVKTLKEDRNEIIRTLKEDRTEMKQLVNAIIEAIKSFKAGQGAI